MYPPTRLLFTLSLTILLVLQLSRAVSQNKIKIEGYTTHTDKKGKKTAVADVHINVYKGADKTDEYATNKKGKFEFQLDFGFNYKIALEGNDGYIDMCFTIDAKIPETKQNFNPTIAVDFVLIDRDNSEIDSLKFKFPFTKFKYDGGKKFVDDPKYLNDFTKGMFKEYIAAKKQAQMQIAEKAKNEKANANTHFLTIGGKLLAGNPPTKAIQNMKVLLKDEKGSTVETSGTDKFGKFMFSKLAADKNYFLSLDDNDSSSLYGQKITLFSKYGKSLMTTNSDDKGGFKFQLLSSDHMTLSELQVEDNDLLIAGTLEEMINDKNQALPNIRISLVNATTGQIYETVESNEAGKFVFSKLPPDKNFAIRSEGTISELANMKIFVKDRNGVDIASGTADGFGKFRFQLLSSDKEMMNNMEVEESDLKMDLFGKFLGGENNNPVKDLKVVLMDDAGKILQTSATDDKGIFRFNNLLLYAGYFFVLDDKDPAVSSLSAITLADLSDKPVKEYKIEIGQPLKRRILASDQRHLGRLYLK